MGDLISTSIPEEKCVFELNPKKVEYNILKIYRCQASTIENLNLYALAAIQFPKLFECIRNLFSKLKK